MTISETDFAYRLDRWDTYGGNIIQPIAIIDDLELAMAAYKAACKRWPGEAITLRQGARIIKATAFNISHPRLTAEHLTGLSAWMQSNPREDAELNTQNPCENERARLRADTPL